jgi:Transglutaminase-like superfamily
MLVVSKQVKCSEMGELPDCVQTLTIPAHVHVCVTGDGSVLLDLKRDRYLGLGKEDTEFLAAAISAWPKPRWDCRETCLASPAAALQGEALCRSLVADGLLVQGAAGRIHRPEVRSHDMAREWISIGDELEVATQVTLRDVATFAAAFIWARGSLAWRPFWMTVETIRAKKAGRYRDVDQTQLLDVAALVGVFRQLRPFAFAAEGRCLLHALTLTRFLSLFGLYPEWVIGVATRPWAAHSWVQWGNLLLDTNPDKVCRYTPILVV